MGHYACRKINYYLISVVGLFGNIWNNHVKLLLGKGALHVGSGYPTRNLQKILAECPKPQVSVHCPKGTAQLTMLPYP